MSDRNELAEILETMEGPLLHIADAILAAGYRKSRQVTTVEELDALPDWSVLFKFTGPRRCCMLVVRHE